MKTERELALNEVVYFSYEDRLFCGRISVVTCVTAWNTITNRGYQKCEIEFRKDGTLHRIHLFSSDFFRDPREAYQKLADSLEQRRVEAVKALESYQRKKA